MNMNYKLYARLAVASGLILASAFPARISAKTFENGWNQLAVSKSYETVLSERLKEEAEPLQETLDQIDVTAKAESFPAKRIYDISDQEFNILTRIVEAEATDKDMKSKILVANVVLNRWKSSQFPDTIEEVVFQRENGAVQF